MPAPHVLLASKTLPIAKGQLKCHLYRDALPHRSSHKLSMKYGQDPSYGPSWFSCLPYYKSSLRLVNISCIALYFLHQLVLYSAAILSHCSIKFQSLPSKYGISLSPLSDELSDFLPGLVSADSGTLRTTLWEIPLGVSEGVELGKGSGPGCCTEFAYLHISCACGIV